MQRPFYDSIPFPNTPSPPPTTPPTPSKRRSWLTALVLLLLTILTIGLYYFLFHRSHYLYDHLPCRHDDESLVLFDLRIHFNNRGWGNTADKADFDGLGNYYDMAHQETHIIKTGTLDFCLHVGDRVDNFVPWSSSKNTTTLVLNEIDPTLYLGAVYLLVASNHGPLPSVPVTAHYHDNDKPSITHTTDLSIPDWQSGHLHQIRHMHVPCTANTGATAAMFAVPIYVDPSRSLGALSIPNSQRLHIFGATGITVPSSWSSQETGSSIRIIDAQATFDNMVKVTVHNVGTKPVGPFRVHIEQHGYKTVQVLAPGHWTHVVLPCQPGERYMTLRVHAGGQVATFSVEFPR